MITKLLLKVKFKTWNFNRKSIKIEIYSSMKFDFKLAIKTADCAAIVFYDKNNF